MEDPRPQIQAALKDAMKNQNKERRDVLRLLQSAFKQAEVDARIKSLPELTVDDFIDVLQREAKKRRETITDLTKAGREDQVPKEEQELIIIEEFLPRQMSEAEVTAIVQAVMAEVGDVSPKEIGKVMGPVMQQVKGQADGKLVSKIVREQLNA